MTSFLDTRLPCRKFRRLPAGVYLSPPPAKLGEVEWSLSDIREGAFAFTGMCEFIGDSAVI